MEEIVSDKVFNVVNPFTRFEHAVVGCLYMTFCIVGSTTNLLTAVTFYKDSKLLQGSKPWLHIALALCNIAVVGPSPFPASSSFSGKWLYGSSMCQLYAFEGMFVGIFAIGLVIALCIERYVVGSKSNQEKTGWFYVSAITVNFCLSFFWACMPLLGWTRYVIDPTGTTCALDWHEPDDGFMSYMISLELCSFGLPLVIAALCLYWSQPTNPVDQGVGSSSGTAQQPQVVVTDESNRMSGFNEDQLRTMCYIFLMFVLVGWGPFALLCTMSMFSGGTKEMSMLASSIPPLACKFMVTAYPVAYAIASPRFRNSFCATFRMTEPQKQD